MAIPEKRNIFTDPARCHPDEFSETVIAGPGVRLERIVSRGQSTPPGQWLSQDTDEWVVLLSGSARLMFFDGPAEMTLIPGDHITIPAGCSHRVEWTKPHENTVWLAFHYPSLRQSRIKEIKVIRTRRRSRSASARMVKDTLYVRVPARIADGDLQAVIKDLRGRIEKKLLKKDLNSDRALARRAFELNKQYFSGKLRFESIEYVMGQNAQFGCCDYECRKIRIAHHVAFMPAWVRDYVLVHELAHLVCRGHGTDFWDIVNRYRHTERAKGYLLAKGYELNEEAEQG